jgi:hypothetical protein
MASFMVLSYAFMGLESTETLRLHGINHNHEDQSKFWLFLIQQGGKRAAICTERIKIQ